MTTHLDTLILGAGPAGVQLAWFMHKAGHDYLVLDAADHVGSFFSLYPRHRTLLSINKVNTGRDDPEFNMRHDWNSLVSDDPKLRVSKLTKAYFPPADALLTHLEQFVRSHDLRVALETRVEQVRRLDEGFELLCHDGRRYTARTLVVATGTSLPFVPDIEGIELAESYEAMSVDPEDFLNKNVLILGKGNSAFETADNLVPSAAVIHMLSPHPVTLAWDSRFVGHVRAVNNNFLDTYHLKSQNGIIDGNIRSMSRTENGTIRVIFSSIHADNEVEQIEYDTVLRCTGFRFDASIFDASCAPALTDCGRLPRMDSGFESVNVQGLFFAGTLTQQMDYKRAQSAFIHGFRHNAESLAALLGRRLHGTPLPSEELASDPDGLSRALLSRMNRVASLWQQVGFLADLIVLPEQPGEPAHLYPAHPYDYLLAHGHELSEGRDFYISMFRLGENPPSPHDYDRTTNVYEGAASTNIHPVIERRSGADGALQSTFHVLEDFLADWSGDEYHASCVAYFERSMHAEAPQGSAPTQRWIVRDAQMRLVNTPAGAKE